MAIDCDKVRKKEEEKKYPRETAGLRGKALARGAIVLEDSSH